MRDLLVSGARVMTSDDVADALLDYALELASHHATAVARFPALVDGQYVDTRMILGAGIPLTAVSADPGLPVSIDGAEFAAAQLRKRTSALRGRAMEQ
jgi:hypothetical protein